MAPAQQEQDPKTPKPPSETEADDDGDQADHDELPNAHESQMTVDAEMKSMEKKFEETSDFSQTDRRTSDEQKEEVHSLNEHELSAAHAQSDDMVNNGTESHKSEQKPLSATRRSDVARSGQSIENMDRPSTGLVQLLPRTGRIENMDRPSTGLVQQLPRGAGAGETDTKEPVQSTGGAPTFSIGKNVTPATDQNVTEQFQLPQFTKLETERHQTTQGFCHPSKLVRDNSASALQPQLSHHEEDDSKDDMPPNSMPLPFPPPRVDEESEAISTDSCNLEGKDVATWESLTTRETLLPNQDDLDDLDASTTSRPESVARATISTQDDLDYLDTSITSRPESGARIAPLRSAADVSASPSHRTGPSFYQEEPHESGIVMAPPGTVVIQHANGEHAFAALQRGPYPYSVQYPIVQHGMQSLQHIPAQTMPSAPPSVSGGGRRKISLRLEEDVKDSTRKSFFFRRRTRSMGDGIQSLLDHQSVDRGSVSVSWFEGTSSNELQEHVRRSVIRKLNLDSSTQLVDLRIIDQSVEPHEEIVLSPFIPDGSTFLLRFSTRPKENPAALSRISSEHRTVDYSAPESPSAAPSPYPSNADLANLNAQLLSGRLNDLKPPMMPERRKSALKQKPSFAAEHNGDETSDSGTALKKVDETDTASRASEFDEDDVMDYSPEDQIDARLHQLAELLIADRKTRRSSRRQKEKRQVVFVIANYFVLFLSLIALLTELSARAPAWLQWVESQLESVQKCSTDQETLIECVSKGDFPALVATLILWLSRSAATHKFFLFGFDTPKKLWTVVYESMVTALCWGTSYMLIRRGMNPDTRAGFVRKYWKDAVYGSLAGFNAAFMKQVLKNLIPQEAFEDALLKERQLKILSWLPSFH